jgi:long-chain acyl-CoA synthetase
MNRKHSYPLYEQHEYPTFRDFVEGAGQKFADRIAISYRPHPSDAEAKRVTYAQFADDVRALGTELIARGLTGKQCALIGTISYGWVCTYFAALSVGVVLVPLDRDWTAEDLTDTVRNAECVYLISDANISGKAVAICEGDGLPAPVYLSDAPAGNESLSDLIAAGAAKRAAGDRSFEEVSVDPTKMATLVFTSGTTGQGKGVMLSQKALLCDIAEGLRLVTVHTKSIAVLPPHHTYGSTIGILSHIMVGSEVYLSCGLKYVPRELQQEKPSYLILVPLFLETFYRRIMATVREKGKETLVRRMMKLSNGLRKIGIDLRRKLFKSVLTAFGGNLETVICGGAPLNQEIIDTFDALGVTVLNGYGITECAPLIAVNRNEWQKAGSIGQPISVDQVRIDDPNEDGEGEISVKGPNVMLGYWKNEAATAEAIDSDGFFHTGDYGKLDEDGWLYITGRKKNLIILSNGKNVYPEEIEAALSGIPGAGDIVVYEGVSRRGIEYNAIVAEIHPDYDYCKQNGIGDIEAHFHTYIENYNRTAVPYKKIGLLRVREEDFPKNTLRKITRFKLDRTID